MINSTVLIIAILVVVITPIWCMVFKSYHHQTEMVNQQRINRTDTKNFATQLAPPPSKKEGENPKVFISYPIDCKCKWEELTSELQSFGYDVFLDNDSEDKNDGEHCKTNICLSSLIIILVDYYGRFLYNDGRFWDEIQLISLGMAEGKRIYVCSYGSKNPLSDALNKCIEDNRKQILKRLDEHVVNHRFNYDNIKKIAEKVNDAYNKR